jgi:hypothetical protein
MGAVQRGVVKGSNKEGPGGDSRANGYLPLGGGAATVHPANAGDRRGGSASLAGGAPAIQRANDRFNVDQAQMPQPASAIEPGKGAIPVNPFLPGGAIARITGIEADEAKAK